MIVLLPNYNIHARELNVTDIDNIESISTYADIKEWCYKFEKVHFINDYIMYIKEDGKIHGSNYKGSHLTSKIYTLCINN